MNYSDLNDYELVTYALSENMEDAMNLIYYKYQPIIVAYSKKMLPVCSNGGVDLNDLIQEGRLGLSNAINKFRESKDITFYTFACTCIKRRIISLAVSTNRLKHKPLNDSLPLITTSDSDDIELDYLMSDMTNEPESKILEEENNNYLKESIKSKLTVFEQDVFDLKIQHFNYEEISLILNKNKKSIDNALQRIKNKVKDILIDLE